MSRERPLRVRVVDGELRIDIGVNVLAFAALRAPHLWDETGRRPDERYRITSPTRFARDVQRALLAEKEDGSTPLEDLLDRVTQEVIEDGSLYFEDTESLP